MFVSWRTAIMGSVCACALVFAACSSTSSMGTTANASTAAATATPMPTATRIPPTPTHVPPTATPAPTATPVPSGPPMLSINPTTTSGTCGTNTQPGRFPPVYVGNSGGGTLQLYVDILAQPTKLNQHFHLSYTLNGAPGNANKLWSFGPGQIGVVQLYQNATTAPDARTAAASSPQSAVTGAFAQLGVVIKGDYMGYEIRYNCANY